MKSRGQIIYGLTIVVIETIIFRLWIYSEKPTPDVSIALVIIIPLIFATNIVVGLIFFFLGKRQISGVLFVNAFVGSIIFYLLWTLWFAGWRDRNYIEYSFEIENTKFEISLSGAGNSFSISDITNQTNGSTTGLDFGEFQIKGDTTVLTGGQAKMVILNNKLFGFPKAPTGIEIIRLKNR